MYIEYSENQKYVKGKTISQHGCQHQFKVLKQITGSYNVAQYPMRQESCETLFCRSAQLGLIWHMFQFRKKLK